MTRAWLLDVPVVPVLLALDRYPDNRGRYWCPFHNDEHAGGKPSAEVRSDPCLLECWSCGAVSTAAELVAAFTGCSVEVGMERALEIAGTIEVATNGHRERRTVSAAQLEAELRRQTEGVRYPRGIDPIEAFVEAKGWPGALAGYARERWGWTGDYRGRVVIPHRTATGELTGLKWRIPPRWDKSGRPGCSYRQLYGVWRLIAGDVEEVWVCEGESDTVWAAYHLEPLGVGVLGAVTALYRARPEELELLRDKTVVVVLDADAAGERGRVRWDEVLTGVAEVLKTVRLPAGEDLCRISIPVTELRERLAVA